MKKIKEFLNWLVFKNPISLVYYAFLVTFFIVTFYNREAIIEHNNFNTFFGLIFFLSVCTIMFTVFSVIPEYKKRND